MSNGVHLTIDPEVLRPLIAQIVAETVAQLDKAKAAIPQKCLSEAEAAAYLGIRPHSLRDERRRGRIAASSIVGRRIRYLQADLLTYLADRRTEVTEAAP